MVSRKHTKQLYDDGGHFRMRQHFRWLLEIRGGDVEFFWGEVMFETYSGCMPRCFHRNALVLQGLYSRAFSHLCFNFFFIPSVFGSFAFCDFLRLAE